MADIRTAVFEDLVPDSVEGSYVIDLTSHPKIGTRQIKAAWFWGSLHPPGDDPNPTTHMNGGFGLTDGTNQLAGAFSARDNAAGGFSGTACASRARTDICLTAIDPVTRTVAYDATINELGEGYIDLAFPVVTGTRYKFGGKVFCGDDIDAYVNVTGTLPGSTTSPIETEIPMPWELGFLLTYQSQPENHDFDDDLLVANTSAYFMLGMATSPDEQFCFDWMSRTNWGPGELDYAMLRNDVVGIGRSGVGVLSGSASNYLRLTSVQPDKFIIRNGRSFSQGFGFCAFRMGNGAQCKPFVRTIPTTPQQLSTTVPGFLPQSLFNVQTGLTAINVNRSDNDEAFGVGVAAEDSEANEFGISWAAQNSDPTNNEHDAQSNGVYGGVVGPDAQGIIGSFVSMDALGVTEDYTTVPGTAAYTLSVAFVEFDQETGEEPSGTSGSEGEGTFEDTLHDVTFPARATAIIPCPAPVSGPPGLAGVEDVEETGNGFWKVVLQGIPIRTNAQVKYWRSIEAKLDGRIGVAVLTICEGKRAPWPADMSDIEIYASGDFAVGDTEGFIQVINGAEPRAGMDFSVGHRIYRLKEVGNASGDIYPVTIWPKVRELIEDGAQLEFVNLQLRSRLENADAMHLMLDLLRFGDPSLTFVEDVLP